MPLMRSPRQPPRQPPRRRTLAPVQARTAKCDVCDRRNPGNMRRCRQCGWQTCHDSCSPNTECSHGYRGQQCSHICPDRLHRPDRQGGGNQNQSQNPKPPGPKKRPESRLTRPAGVRKGRSTRHSQAGPSNSKARPVKPSRSQDEPSCRASAIAGPSKYMPLTPPRDHRSLSEQLDTQEGSPHSDELAGWPAALPIRPRSDEQSSQPEPARTPSPDDNVDAPNGISYDINGYTAIEQDVVWTLTALGFERDMLQNPAKYSHTAQNSRKLAWHWADLAMAKWKQAASLLKKARPSDSDFFTTDEDNSETGDGDDTDDTDYID